MPGCAATAIESFKSDLIKKNLKYFFRSGIMCTIGNLVAHSLLRVSQTHARLYSCICVCMVVSVS